MKNVLIALFMVCLIASISMAQVAGVSKGTSLKTGGTQGIVSGMVGGPHDFTKANYKGTGFNPADTGTVRSFMGGTNSLCSYCHSAHIPAAGVATPLWNRVKNVAANGPYGTYSSIQMDASPTEISTDNSVNNYSAFCLGCHDGSAIFAASKYTSTPYVSGGWPGTTGTPGFDTLTMPFETNVGPTGQFGGLSHIHPVNFSYATAATNDAGLYPAPAGTQGYMTWDATYGALGRLFGGTVQCSSCHNPHNNSKGILLEGSSNYGALCVACHKK